MRRVSTFFMLILSLLFLAGITACAKPAKTSSSYNLGILQHQLLPSQVLVGKASWYGPYFHGRKTANGETYNMYGLTAAHKTLPLGSFIKVTNLENQKELFVRINDRGPYIPGRILDLSFAAAKSLDMIQKGISNVKVEVYSPNASPLMAMIKR